MNRQRHVRKLLSYFASKPAVVSPRKHAAVIAVLLAMAAIAVALVLTKPGHLSMPRSKPDVWQAVRQRVSQRAQVDLFDDFTQGLQAWQSGENLACTWRYDQHGFVNPGALSLFQPTLHLTNYDLDALVQIEAKGLGLAFRAASIRTYQVVKLVVEGSGSMPSLAVDRYAIISGHATRAVRTRYPKRFQADTLYRVHLEVHGETFSLYVQGNLMDYWSDARLGVGGVGLFCSKGERARVAWVRVSHNTDSWGRMCSFLSPML
jgi:hypothetical protein